jgi:hypothetical protein
MNILEKVLNDVSLDARIKDGIFSIEENTHMDVLREYFVERGINEELVVEYCNLVVEGKYPERQAYNQKGILVTFPTPEYKKRALERGTHFEKNPTKGQSNLFTGQPGAQQQAPQSGEPPAAAPPEKAPVTNLPLSQAGVAVPPSDTLEGDGEEASKEPTTTAAPIQVPSQVAEPVVKPEEPPPPTPPPSPAEKEANKQAIKQMLKGDDYMLERVVEFILEKGHPMLVEDIYKKL